ncbi:MAG TPA: sialidase family protein, partial [Gemmataceae bacterium]|nr:sialidase family protein [Gemmataceae bacterium]
MARTRKLLSPRAPHAASRRFNTIRDRLERLEDRTVPAFTNVLVNNPAADLGSNDTQSETTLVLAGSNVVVAFNDSGSNAGNTKFTGFAQSTNGGATFTDKGTLPTSTSGDAGDPALARDNVSGTIYLATLGYSSSNVIQVFRSTDGGATFGAPVNAASGFSSGHSLDKEWIAVDNAPGVGQGTVYVVFTDFGSIFGPDNGVFLTRSTNGGA